MDRHMLSQLGEAVMGAVVVIALLIFASVEEVVWEDPHQPATAQPAREGRAAFIQASEEK